MKKWTRLLAFVLAVIVSVPTQALTTYATQKAQDEMTQDLNALVAEMEADLLSSIEDSVAVEMSGDVKEDKAIEDMTTEEYQAWKQSYVQDEEYATLNRISDVVDPEFASNESSGYVRNSIIEAYVRSDGRFTIGTVAGSDRTTDNNKKLLYGHPGSGTSHTTIRLDGVDYTFQANSNWVQTKDAIMVSDVINKVVTTQSISIVENEYTGAEDTVAVTYTVTNHDTKPHNAGIRIMMDTMLSGNDGAPFRVPGYGNVTKELELTGAAIPQNWMAFDSLSNPSIIASGCLFKDNEEKPDKVQFTHWGSITGTMWNYTVTPTKAVTGDSAVAMYYNPIELAAGESRTITTYYGIGEFAVTDEKPPLSIKVMAPNKLVANTETGGYENNPYTVTAYISNTGNGVAKNVRTELNLPKDGSLVLITPTNSEQSLGDIEPGKEKTVNWTVQAKSQSAKKTAKYNVTVEADNEAKKTVNISTELPATKVVNADYTINLNKTKLDLDVDGTNIFTLKATCSDKKKRNITWLSSNSSVAKVDSKGFVTAVSGGTANIVASTGDASAICQVTVKGTKKPLEKIQLNQTSLNLKIGQVRFLKEVYTPSSTTQTGVKWTSSNPAVAKVNENGKVEAIAYGTAVITATANADKTKKATCTVQVGSSIDNLSLQQNVSFNETIYGPTVSVLGKTFNLFKFPASMEISLNEAFKLSYSEADATITGSFGLKDGNLFDQSEYKDDAKKIKKAAELMKKMGPKKFINTYGKVLTNKKDKSFILSKPSWNVFGYVKLQQIEGDYKLSEGNVYMVVDLGEYGWKFNLPAAPVVYFKFSLSGTFQGGLDLKLEEYGVEHLGTLKVNGSLGVEAVLTGAVGADILIAGLEGGIRGKLNFNIGKIVGFQPVQDLLVKVSAEAYVKASALFFLNFEKSWEFASAQLYPKTSSNSSVEMLTNIENEDFVPMSLNLADAPLGAIGVDSEAITYKALPNNGYAYNEPDMVELSDGRILAVWTDAVEGRAEFNRTGIFYAIYENGEWSEAVLVDDDGTADFTPAIATNKTEAYVVWQNVEKIYEDGEEVTLEDMLPYVGVKAAYFDGTSFINTVSLTQEADGYDNLPYVTAGSDNATVVYSNNKDNDWTGFSGVNEIKQVTLEYGEIEQTVSGNTVSGNTVSGNTVSGNTVSGNTVSGNNPQEPVYGLKVAEETTVFSAEKIVTAYSVATHNNQAVVVVRTDEDGDLTTSEDGLNRIYFDGTENTGYSDVVKGSMPKFVQREDAADLFWWDGTVIKSMKSMDASTITASIALDNALPYEVSYKNGDYVIYWSETDSDVAAVVASYYNAETNEWTNPVPVTSGQNCTFRSPKILLQENGELFMLVDAVTLNSNWEDTGVSLYSMYIVPKVDIQVDPEMYFTESAVGKGKTITLFADVVNAGMKPAENFTLTLTDGRGNLIDTKTENITLKAGEETTVSMDYTLPVELVKHNVKLTVLAQNANETVTSDNVATATIGEASIVISDIQVTGNGRVRNVVIEVANEGYATENNITITLRDGSETGTVLGSTTISSLEARSKRVVSLDIDMMNVDFQGENSKLLYVKATNNNGDLGILASATTLLHNPEIDNRFSITSGAYDNKTLHLNVYNNRDEETTADVIIELLNGEEIAYSMSQSITLDGYGSETYRYGISPFLIYAHDRICVYVRSEDGTVLSNLIYHNSMQTAPNTFELEMDKTYLVMKAGDTQELSAEMNNKGMVLSDLVWESSDEEVAIVSQTGQVTAVKAGTAVIAVKSANMGYSAECRVVVTDETPGDDYNGAFLRTTNITVDLAKETGTSVAFTPMFNVASQSLKAEGDAEAAFASSVIESITLAGEGSEGLFEAELTDDGHFIVRPTAEAASKSAYVGKKYKVNVIMKLKGTEQENVIGELTIKTKKTKVTADVSVGKLNSFYTTDNADVKVSSKYGDIESVEIDTVADSKNKNPEYFTLTDGKITLAEAYKATVKSGKYKVRFIVKVKDCIMPVAVTKTITVVDNAPKLKLDKSTVKLLAKPNANQVQMTLSTKNKNDNISNYRIVGISASEGYYGAYSNYNDYRYVYIRSAKELNSNEKAYLNIRLEGANRDISLPINVKVVKEEKYTLSSKKGKINVVTDGTNYRNMANIKASADNARVSSYMVKEVINGEETELTNFYVSINSNTGELSARIRANNIPIGKYKLRLYLNQTETALDFEVEVVAKQPVFKASKKAITLNAATREPQTINISNNYNVHSYFTCTYKDSKGQSCSSVASYSYDSTYKNLTITPYSGVKPGKYTMVIKSSSFSEAKPITITLNVKSQAPKYSLSSKKVTLNSALDAQESIAEITLKSNPKKYAQSSSVYFRQVGANKAETSVRDFVITGNQNTFSIRRASNGVADGTYKLRAYVSGYGDVATLDFTVVVKEKAPVFKQKDAITLNSNLPEVLNTAEITMKSDMKLKKIGEFTFFQKKGSELAECSDVKITSENGKYYVTLAENTTVTNGTIKLVAKSSMYPSKDTEIKVKVTSKVPTLELKNSGKIDKANSFSSILCKMSFKNANIATTTEGTLTISNKNFELYSYNASEGSFRIKAAADADFSTAGSNKAVVTYRDPSGVEFATQTIAFTVKSPKVTFTPASKSYDLYLADALDEAKVSFTVKGSEHVVVDEIKITGNDDFTIRQISASNYKYAIAIKDHATMKKGTYNLPIEIKVRGLDKVVKTNVKIVVK